ncbi:MAG: histidine phosphatase family protein [Dehalococcoidia bacterium]
MKLILVRHGETHWNHEKRVQGGDADIELNETGLAQARKVAAFLKHEPVTAVLSSPLQRARATAEIIAGHHSLPLQIAEGLREIRVGELDGMTLSSLTTTFSQFLVKWWQDRAGTELPDGESFAQLQNRAWKVVEGLLDGEETVPAQGQEKAVVVVSHYFVILAIILKALDLPPDSFTRFKVDLAGVSTLEFADLGTRLVTFNDTSY